MKKTLSRVLVTLSAAACLLSTVPANEAFAQNPRAIQAGNERQTKIGLDGYCPVCIVEMQKWEKGNPQISSTVDGTTYYFPSDAIRQKFDQDPVRYVPALGGDCTVCYEKLGKRVPGSVQFASIFEGRLFLFPSANERSAFDSNPALFANTDLALDGECIVCQVKVGKHVPGKPEFTVVYDGFRYLFPSPAEAEAFQQSPAEYVKRVGSQQSLSMKAKTSNVEFVGRSGCAGCEFGVKPIGSPDELGLAIVKSDGGVVVVENAHRDYPAIYAARFDGNKLAVRGQVIRSVGNVDWIQPTSLFPLK